MADIGARISTSWVKIKPLDGTINTVQSNREKVGEIYRLTPDHLAFVCAHCDEEFPLLIQFTAHIQSHLIHIHSQYIEPNGCDDIFDDDDVCTEVDENSQMQTIIEEPIVCEPTVPVVASNSVGDKYSMQSEVNDWSRAAKRQMTNFPQCPTCKKHFKALAIHLRRSQQCNPSARVFECYLCRASFNTEQNCKLHMRAAHTSESRQCDYCGDSISVNSSLHNKLCGPFNSYKCKRCPFSFRAVGLLHVHAKKVHDIKAKKNFRCKLCEETFDERAARLLHMQNVHSDETQFKCHRCLSLFAVRTDLIKHGIACTGGGYTCRICGQTFDDQAARSAHLQTHEKKFQCDECGRQFFQQSQLSTHMNSHSDVAEFKCDQCPRAYKYRSDLSSHRKSHLAERQHKCELCTSSFHVKKELTRHLFERHRISRDARKLSETFECHICHAVLSNRSRLNIHIRRHTGQNNMQCSQCGFKCPMQCQLDRHMISHSDRRDFQCDLCPKAFKLKDALVAHKRIHLGDFKFKCKWCDKGYHDNRIFKKHTIAAHGRQWDDEGASD